MFPIEVWPTVGESSVIVIRNLRSQVESNLGSHMILGSFWQYHRDELCANRGRPIGSLCEICEY